MSGKGRPFTNAPPSWFTPPWPRQTSPTIILQKLNANNYTYLNFIGEFLDGLTFLSTGCFDVKTAL